MQLKTSLRNIAAVFYILSLCAKNKEHPRVFLRLNTPLEFSGSFASKTEIYSLCDYHKIPPTLLLRKSISSDTLEEFINKNGFPLILKKDHSHRSIGIHIANDIHELEPLLKEGYVLQKYIPHEMEIGVFFVNGKITGIGRKKIPKNKKFVMPHYTKYINTPDLLTEKVREKFEHILKNIPHDYGRFDVLITDKNSFAQNLDNFYINEINYGIDTIPIHEMDYRKPLSKHIHAHKKYINMAFELCLMQKLTDKQRLRNYLKKYFSYTKKLHTKSDHLKIPF